MVMDYAGMASNLMVQDSGGAGRRKVRPVFDDPFDYENRMLNQDAAVTTVTPTVTPTPTPTRTVTPTTTVASTTETGPKEGDLKEGPDGKILRFNGTTWSVVNASSTREVITQDPAAEPAPGADANVPINKYMESLGTDTLAGQAYSEALARRLASIDEQQLSAGQSYGDMYEQAKMSQARRRGLSDTGGMTGGMEAQMGARISAAEMGALGQIGMGREATMRQLEQQELDAPMAAFEEGRQIEAYERSKAMMDRELAQAQTLFDQAQSGWMQNEDGTWTNLDKEMQDSISLQAINAQQRGEVLGEMQYWQAILADPTQLALHEGARSALGELQTRYGTLLTNSRVITGRPNTPGTDETDTPQTEVPEPQTIINEDGIEIPRVTPDDGGVVIETGKTLTGSMNSYIETILPSLGITDETPLPNFANSIRTAKDLSPFIVKLAGDKAGEGYDFATELELVNRYLKTPAEVTKAEYERLQDSGMIKKNVDYYKAAHNVEIGSGGSYVKLFADNPANVDFVEELINKGYIPRDQAVTNKDNAYSLGILGPIRAANNNFDLTWASLYDDFLAGSLRSVGSGTMSATQAAGYSQFDPRTLR